MYYLADRIWIRLKSVYLRITLNKVTATLFLFTFLHCFAQGLIQSFLFSLDDDANALTSAILQEAQVPPRNFAWLMRHHGNFTLQLCSAVPVEKPVSPCMDVFVSGAGVLPIPQGFRRRSDHPALTRRSGVDVDGTHMQGVQNSSGVVTGVALSMGGGSTAVLSEQCTRVMVYVDQVLKNSKREELALIGSEFWMFGLLFFAVLYDSVPHLLAGLSMRFLSVGWSAYAIWRTGDINERFRVLVTDGACGMDLFPTYFSQRIALQIPDLVLNVVALSLSIYLVWRLVEAYSEFTFKRVGAPEHLIRLYRFFLGVFVCLQLSVFLLVTSMALWIDQLVNSAIAKISSHTPIYLGLFIFTIIVLIPWLSMGWFAVRREMKRTMGAFLSIAFVFIACWAIMYYSQVYRWTWIQWPFFASVTTAAQLVLVAAAALGVVCWRNFRRGLAHYLYVENTLRRADFEPELFPHDLEKRLPSRPPRGPRFTLALPRFVPGAPAPADSWPADVKRPPSAHVHDGRPARKGKAKGKGKDGKDGKARGFSSFDSTTKILPGYL